MAKLNAGKVVAGGILAALVFGGFDFVSNNFLLADAWQEVAHLRNIDPAVMTGTGALATMIVIYLLLGLTIVLTYAAIRPRFGPGPGTAAIASFLIVLPMIVILAGFAPWFIPWDLWFRQSAVTFAATIVAGYAGGWVYAEEESERA